MLFHLFTVAGKYREEKLRSNKRWSRSEEPLQQFENICGASLRKKTFVEYSISKEGLMTFNSEFLSQCAQNTFLRKQHFVIKL